MVKYDFDSDDMERKEIIRRLGRIKKSLMRRNKIKNIISNEEVEPYVIELCGLPKTGKTLCIEKIKDFFSKQGITVKVLDDPVSDLTYKKLKNMSSLNFIDNMVEAKNKELEAAKKEKPDIIIMENGLVDSYFFYQELYDNGKISEKEFYERIKILGNDLKNIDQLYIMNASLTEVYKRDNKVILDFLIEKKENINRFFNTLASIGGSKICEINTDSIDEIYTSLILIDSITRDILEKISNKTSSEKFMNSFMGRLKKDDFKKDNCPKDDCFVLNERVVESEVDKYKKTLNTDIMKLIMKKD